VRSHISFLTLYPWVCYCCYTQITAGSVCPNWAKSPEALHWHGVPYMRLLSKWVPTRQSKMTDQNYEYELRFITQNYLSIRGTASVKVVKVAAFRGNVCSSHPQPPTCWFKWDIKACSNEYTQYSEYLWGGSHVNNRFRKDLMLTCDARVQKCGCGLAPRDQNLECTNRICSDVAMPSL